MQGRGRKEPYRDTVTNLPLPLREEVGGRGPCDVGMARRVAVMLPYPFPGPFDYRVPLGMDRNPATWSWFR